MVENPLVAQLKRTVGDAIDGPDGLPATARERLRNGGGRHAELSPQLGPSQPTAPPRAERASEAGFSLAAAPSGSVGVDAPREAAAEGNESAPAAATGMLDDAFWQLETSASAADADAARSPLTLDLEELVKIFGGNADLVKMALQRFDCHALRSMRGAWEGEDYQDLSRRAHQTKGSCAYIAAKEAQRAASRLEQSAKALAAAGRSEYLCREVADALHDLRTELVRLVPAVPLLLAELEQKLQDKTSGTMR